MQVSLSPSGHREKTLTSFVFHLYKAAGIRSIRGNFDKTSFSCGVLSWKWRCCCCCIWCCMADDDDEDGGDDECGDCCWLLRKNAPDVAIFVDWITVVGMPPPFSITLADACWTPAAATPAPTTWVDSRSLLGFVLMSVTSLVGRSIVE